MASAPVLSNGDLNNVSSMRPTEAIVVDESFAFTSLAIPEDEDDATTRSTYRPFILSTEVTDVDWISRLELATVTEMSQKSIAATKHRLRVLVLYGSLRPK